MKKVLAIALALVMVLGLAACGGSKTSTTTTPAEPAAKYGEINPGKLTVATSPDFAPYEFYTVGSDGTYTLAGFDMALAKYIADDMGLELEVIPMDFDGVLAELAAKTVDLGIAGLSPDPDRMDKMDFSDIYYEGGQSFCVKKGNESLFADLAATNDSQYSVAAQNGSIQMKLAQEHSANADIIALTKVTDIIAELISGKIDGAYIETAVAESYAKNYPDLVVMFEVPYDVEGSAIGVSKGNADLLAGVNAAIAKALADGSMDQFVADANEAAAGEIFEGLVQ
jgi:polar amino acid transport system substrate-binding protein